MPLRPANGRCLSEHKSRFLALPEGPLKGDPHADDNEEADDNTHAIERTAPKQRALTLLGVICPRLQHEAIVPDTPPGAAGTRGR